MDARFTIDILPQPDDHTCGPTCLHAVYRHLGYEIPLTQLIQEVTSLEGGGTLAVYLGLHSLKQGFDATLVTYDLQVFDPTWFADKRPDLKAKLIEQLQHKKDPKIQLASNAYIEFLNKNGNIRFEDLTAALLRRYLKNENLILTGLSATYLYSCAREQEVNNRMVYDDIRGEPVGHFVVLTGYDQETHTVWVADPLRPNPMSPTAQYSVNINRLICAIMLGILTYDANLLIIKPKQVV